MRCLLPFSADAAIVVSGIDRDDQVERDTLLAALPAAVNAAETAPSSLQLDLRAEENCKAALTVDGGTFDEVYQLAADMGGMGFIHSAETEIMHNSVLINIYMTDLAARMGVPRYFFSSSVCVYRDMKPGEPEMTEAEAIPAHPDNEYGWEKLYSERVAEAYERRYGMQVRIARFQNCYGPEGTWTGGREKAPAAMCRKVAEAQDGSSIEVWGDGSAIRSYTYVGDMVDGIVAGGERFVTPELKEYEDRVLRALKTHFVGVVAIDEVQRVNLQEKDGSWWDYPLYNYHQQYGTAYALMSLARCREPGS